MPAAQSPTVLYIFLFFSIILLFIDLQSTPFRPSPVHSANETQSFRFSVKIFIRSALARQTDKTFLARPEPAFVGPVWHVWGRVDVHTEM